MLQKKIHLHKQDHDNALLFIGKKIGKTRIVV